MLASDIVQFVTRPVWFIQNKKTSKKLGFIGVFLASLSMVSQSDIVASQPILAIIVTFIMYCLFLYIQTTMLDFFAQICGHKGNSLTLFCWFGFSLMGICLNVPLYMLRYSVPSFLQAGVMVIEILVIFLIIYWQLQILSSIYQMSVKKSMLIYFFPMLIFLLFMGFLFSFFLFGGI